ncbi:MAG: ribose 5-phosphate isomerase B, partial [Candidatus Eiseniibacteriota bacterium]
APAPAARAARVVDWTKPAPGDVRPLAESPGAKPGQSRTGERAAAPAPDPARTVALGGDHGGFALKETLRRYLKKELRYAVIDCGTHSTEAVDYPDIARAVGEAVADGRAARGIVIDGAGIGSTMAANRIPGVRCALCHDLKTVLNSREHNDANVLALGSGIVHPGLARQMVRTWLATPFAGGRHARRVAKIMELERMTARAAERNE